ncbi:hypothetical protein H113_05436 [Trichophyton rubrum MR1459]|nr:hypothetical protein H113_05436 [Trichophyton rubrum MR1459]KMQ43192.1 hypothetical protein HL42_6113 [Trichophyton rubrum]
MLRIAAYDNAGLDNKEWVVPTIPLCPELQSALNSHSSQPTVRFTRLCSVSWTQKQRKGGRPKCEQSGGSRLYLFLFYDAAGVSRQKNVIVNLGVESPLISGGREPEREMSTQSFSNRLDGDGIEVFSVVSVQLKLAG